MVLMAVGDEKAADPRAVFDEVADVGNDAVDAVHVVPGEGHAAVHHDDLAAVFIGGHVLADLIETAQGNDFQFFCHRFEILLFPLKSVRLPRLPGMTRQTHPKMGTQIRDVRCLHGPVSPAGVRSRHPGSHMGSCLFNWGGNAARASEIQRKVRRSPCSSTLDLTLDLI